MRYTFKEIHSFVYLLITRQLNSDRFNFNYFSDNLFWDRLLIFSSSQLIVPMVFYELNRIKDIVKPPKKLLEYLNEIAMANEERNLEIKKQILSISEIFCTNKINYVFLKGAALLIRNQKNNLKTRMLGDIDILISDHDLVKANDLLMNNGYETLNLKNIDFTENIDGFKNRHLGRLINKNSIAAVELHSDLLKYGNDKLINQKSLLETKCLIDNKYFIPNKNYIWEHAILNWQVNDNGYKLNYLSFRTLIDVLDYEPLKLNYDLNNKSKEFKHFYTLLSTFDSKYPNYYNFKRKLYKFQISYKFANKLIQYFVKISDFLILIKKHIHMLFIYKDYRKKVFKNPTQIFKKLNDKLNNF